MEKSFPTKCKKNITKSYHQVKKELFPKQYRGWQWRYEIISNE